MTHQTGRQEGLDALKAATTLLVVFHHTAITYGAIGGWFYREIATDRSPSSLLLVFFCTVNQAWFMGLFFLLAGRFTPQAIAHRGARAYVGDRLLRLGLPWLVFGYLIGPPTVALARKARGEPFFDTLTELWRHAVFVNGPTWFASALLLFSVAAAAWLGRPAHGQESEGHGSATRQRLFPGNLALLWAALGCAAAAFGLRLVWPVGTDVGGFQLGYFASYVLLFAFGCMAARHGWFEALPAAQVRLWRRVTWFTLPTLLPLAFLTQRFPVLQGPATGGWNIPSLTYALWEPFVAWGVLLALLQWAARPRPPAGPLRRALARRAYAIFVIHPPVVVAAAVAWHGVAAPALLKFVLTGTASSVACFWLAGALLRMPVVRRVL